MSKVWQASPWPCTAVICDRCKKFGHLAKDCKPGHFRKDFPKNNKTGIARVRAFNINSTEARDDPKLVMGTFSLNDQNVYILFDTGADRSFISKDICHNIKNPISPLDNIYSIELGNAEVVCDQKAIRIPNADGEPMMVYGEKSNTQLPLINCLKVQKYVRKGCITFMTHLSKVEPEDKRPEDVPIVKDFQEVFPDVLPGLPPHQEVEFQILLVPGPAPVAHIPYRLVPPELQELSSQLQELLLSRIGRDKSLKVKALNIVVRMNLTLKIRDAQLEAVKQENVDIEFIKGLDKKFDIKEDRTRYFANRIWVPKFGGLRELVLE
ncbi:uncharacterized protein [Rutidosis leptorrhynchoides]|uniref:uncharacterized protein n=1 Tax=Rutidosis leptorrhynchoides TaxID=125765 RepID=UPI003A9A3D29